MGLLRVSAQQHPQSGYAALDSTFFGRRSATSYYRQRSGNNVQTLRITILTVKEFITAHNLHILAQ